MRFAMLFNSFECLLFLPMVFALNYALPVGKRWALLLVASCYFYMVLVPQYILVLAAIILFDFVAGRVIENAVGVRRKTLLVAMTRANLWLLAACKSLNCLV